MTKKIWLFDYIFILIFWTVPLVVLFTPLFTSKIIVVGQVILGVFFAPIWLFFRTSKQLQYLSTPTIRDEIALTPMTGFQILKQNFLRPLIIALLPFLAIPCAIIICYTRDLLFILEMAGGYQQYVSNGVTLVQTIHHSSKLFALLLLFLFIPVTGLCHLVHRCSIYKPITVLSKVWFAASFATPVTLGLTQKYIWKNFTDLPLMISEHLPFVIIIVCTIGIVYCIRSAAKNINQAAE